MPRPPSPLCLAPALLLLAGGAIEAQPARLPAEALRPPAPRFTAHPYTSALSAEANYESCGAYARGAAVRALRASLRAGEAEAEAKGLGPTLTQLRRDYEAILAVSTMNACNGGPARALRDARHELGAFRAWVAAQPGR